MCAINRPVWKLIVFVSTQVIPLAMLRVASVKDLRGLGQFNLELATFVILLQRVGSITF